MTSEPSKKKGPVQIFKLDTASKLAEQWVKSMSKPAEDEPTEPEQEARPHRLGLGAKVSKQTKRRPSDDPLDQKLQAKLDAGRRKYAKRVAENASSSIKVGDYNSEDDDDDKSESKSRSFGKKKAVPLASPLQAKKKK